MKLFAKIVLGTVLAIATVVAAVLNASRRPERFAAAYGPELRNLIARRESAIIDRFGYACS